MCKGYFQKVYIAGTGIDKLIQKQAKIERITQYAINENPCFEYSEQYKKKRNNILR